MEDLFFISFILGVIGIGLATALVLIRERRMRTAKARPKSRETAHIYLPAVRS
ncbi:MAG: hypothetical protein JRJ35_18135 [Deltaproteobacteria bacterium]|nr:hypothetical protein [Deltaproteobacteria bacterium]MBW1951230.1 hypothetical protein [Deltaproteobacteria bacterium]MBW2006687.1 hypothetical protein [Deltaproteobacteria bacterium]